MSKVFLIAGGGTGAKVAESFVHLCASGHGPREVHILFVDADTMNGNLARAYFTGQAYQGMARFDWNIRTTVGGGLFSKGTDYATTLFSSQVYLYRITEPIQDDGNGALSAAARADNTLGEALDVFYDASEQKTSCSDGFRARPNLGCLLLGQHLKRALTVGDGARFVEALRAAGASGQDVPVVVAASLFGGMGASLLPIARSTVNQMLREGFAGTASTQHFRWASVMMLPHYQPAHAEDSVDPHRYNLDTSNALQFYQKTFSGSAPVAAASGWGAADSGDGRPYDVAYLVGSDNPGRNKVRTSLGKDTQANPAYFEEFLGALAVREFALAPTLGNPVRHYHLPGAAEAITWKRLPLNADESTQLALSMGYLLHLSAFFLRSGSDTRNELTQGLLALLRTTSGANMQRYEFYKHAIDKWADNIEVYRNAPRAERPEVMRSGNGPSFVPAMRPAATEYCARLMHWAETALQGEGLALMEFGGGHYSSLYGHLSGLNSGDFGKAELEDDNALVRLMRGTVAAMLNAEANREQNGKVVGDFSVLQPALSPGLNGREVVAPRVSMSDVQMALQQEQQAGLLREYYANRLDMAPVGG